jgi:hypothetical protein
LTHNYLFAIIPPRHPGVTEEPMDSTNHPAPDTAPGDTMSPAEIAELLELLAEENLPFLMRRQVA